MYLVVVAALGAGTFPSHSGSACPEGMRHFPKRRHASLLPTHGCEARARLRSRFRVGCPRAVPVESQDPQASPGARMLGIIRFHEKPPSPRSTGNMEFVNCKGHAGMRAGCFGSDVSSQDREAALPKDIYDRPGARQSDHLCCACPLGARCSQPSPSSQPCPFQSHAFTHSTPQF